MFSLTRGRPSKDPILPDRIDPNNKKKDIRGQLYPAEWEVLKEKLEERGYSSIAKWIEDQAKKVILDQDLRERKEELERKIDSKMSDIEDLKEELEDIEDRLGDQEEQLEDVKEELKDRLIELVKTSKYGITSPKLRNFIDRSPEDIGFSWKDKGKARKVLAHENTKYSDKNLDPETFADNTLDNWEEEDLITSRGRINQ